VRLFSVICRRHRRRHHRHPSGHGKKSSASKGWGTPATACVDDMPIWGARRCHRRHHRRCRRPSVADAGSHEQRRDRNPVHAGRGSKGGRQFSKLKPSVVVVVGDPLSLFSHPSYVLARGGLNGGLRSGCGGRGVVVVVVVVVAVADQAAACDGRGAPRGTRSSPHAVSTSAPRKLLRHVRRTATPRFT